VSLAITGMKKATPAGTRANRINFRCICGRNDYDYLHSMKIFQRQPFFKFYWHIKKTC
jgi:hypothetical protein